MDSIAVSIHHHRRSLLVIAVGLIILLLHGVVYAQSWPDLTPSIPTDPSAYDPAQLNGQLASQQGAFTRIMAASTVLPPMGQALIIAGLLGWVLNRRTNEQS